MNSPKMLTRPIAMALSLALAAPGFASAAAAQEAAPTPATQAPETAPAIRTLTEQEMIDMMIGSSIQASRTTNTQYMIDKVREAYAEGRSFTMVSPEEVRDDWLVALPGAVGGGGAWDFVMEDVKKANLPTIDDPNVKAMELLADYSGRKIDAIIRVEAAEATIRAFEVASKLGVPVVDACLSGRARPDTRQSIPEALGIERDGLTVGVSRWGDVVVLEHISAPVRGEHLMRALAVASGGGITLAASGYNGTQIRTATIPGSNSEAILWGRTVREAREAGEDPIAALAEVSGGYELFEGVVSKAEPNGDKGFTYWDVELDGTGEYAGHTYKIYVKNENIVTWLDGVPDAMSPDYIANLDPKTGAAISADRGLGGYEIGQEVAMVAIPSSPMWRIERGIELMGPRHFGFDFDYVPIEEQMKHRAEL